MEQHKSYIWDSRQLRGIAWNCLGLPGLASYACSKRMRIQQSQCEITGFIRYGWMPIPDGGCFSFVAAHQVPCHSRDDEVTILRVAVRKTGIEQNFGKSGHGRRVAPRDGAE